MLARDFVLLQERSAARPPRAARRPAPPRRRGNRERYGERRSGSARDPPRRGVCLAPAAKADAARGVPAIAARTSVWSIATARSAPARGRGSRAAPGDNRNRAGSRGGGRGARRSARGGAADGGRARFHPRHASIDARAVGTRGARSIPRVRMGSRRFSWRPARTERGARRSDVRGAHAAPSGTPGQPGDGGGGAGRRIRRGDAGADRGALVAVPGSAARRLHRDAAAAYVRCAPPRPPTASRLRSATRIAHRGRRRRTPRAPATAPPVAAFSSHTLGLAVDLNMSHGGLRFSESDDAAVPEPGGHVHVARPQVDVPARRDARLVSLPSRAMALGVQPARLPRPAAPAGRGAPTAPPRDAERRRRHRRPDSAAAAAARDPGSVGRGGRNLPADVRAVQDRLVELRALDAADAAARATDRAAPAPRRRCRGPSMPIERFQRQTGHCRQRQRRRDRGVTRTELDRAIPQPTASGARRRGHRTERGDRPDGEPRPHGHRPGGGDSGRQRARRRARSFSAGWWSFGSLPPRIARAPAAGGRRPCPQRRSQRRSRRCAISAARRAVLGRVDANRRAARSRPAWWRPAMRPRRCSIAISVYTMTVGSTARVLPGSRRQPRHPERDRRHVRGHGARRRRSRSRTLPGAGPHARPGRRAEARVDPRRQLRRDQHLRSRARQRRLHSVRGRPRAAALPRAAQGRASRRSSGTCCRSSASTSSSASTTARSSDARLSLLDPARPRACCGRGCGSGDPR